MKISLQCLVLMSVALISCLYQGYGQSQEYVFCYTDSGENNCHGNDNPTTVTESGCCNSATIRTTYQIIGSEICSNCPLNTYQCHKDQCGSDPVLITSYQDSGASVCCNGTFSLWTHGENSLQDQSMSTCNPCPTVPATTENEPANTSSDVSSKESTEKSDKEVKITTNRPGGTVSILDKLGGANSGCSQVSMTTGVAMVAVFLAITSYIYF